MSKMSQEHSDSAEQRAEDAERDLAYLKSQIAKVVEDMSKIMEFGRIHYSRDCDTKHLLGRIEDFSNILKGL